MIFTRNTGLRSVWWQLQNPTEAKKRNIYYRYDKSRDYFVCLFGVFRPTREIFVPLENFLSHSKIFHCHEEMKKSEIRIAINNNTAVQNLGRPNPYFSLRNVFLKLRITEGGSLILHCNIISFAAINFLAKNETQDIIKLWGGGG